LADASKITFVGDEDTHIRLESQDWAWVAARTALARQRIQSLTRGRAIWADEFDEYAAFIQA